MDRVVGAAMAVVAGLGSPGASAGATVQYTCPASSPFGQPMTAQFGWDAPVSVQVGEATPATADITATVGSFVTWGLGMNGVATVEGSGEAPATVHAPGRDFGTSVRLTVPRTNVPASGPMTVHVTGTLPKLAFDQPGHTTITLDNELTVQVTARDASSNAASEFGYSCALDSGQNAVVLAFDITPVAAQPTAAPTTQTTQATGAAVARAGAGPTTTPIPAGPTSTAARPSARATTRLAAKGGESGTGLWRIWPTVLGVATIGAITGLLWRGRRGRRVR